ncbi:site-specific DNA-methyltransferase [Actinobacillus capsulatus]|uniref:site-specific DNA-methyltransferase n=1 Tax=Actinobacillus capsulatus TaxID=717 RepID=UPI00037ADD68|nr:site-specific DNA-methyltransferase [Actinobacillus capsulatus]
MQDIFQINQPDLDFGIYRILNSRQTQINEFLQKTLPAKINAALNGNFEQANSVYNHLYTFFSRYYDQGDFISQRRYKGDTYAIPYAGEEVILHWANKDQYYTKSSENFSNYAFALENGKKVQFRLVEADTAKDNRKDNDQTRVFALIEPKINTELDENGDEIQMDILPIEENGDLLTIRFEYKAVNKKEKQADYITQAVEKIQNIAISDEFKGIFDPMPTEKNKNRTLLEKYLTDYTTKNTADYFIHKNLGKFLNQELDFYIKNEVMNLDNIQDSTDFSHIEQNLQTIKTLKTVAKEIIAFLAQLEDFQKKLWLKKKFVAGCHYLITLDHLNEEQVQTALNNPKQTAQWQALVNVETSGLNVAEICKNYPHLVVDTSLFEPKFQAEVLGEIEHLDDKTNGLLIHSDNFQALNLLQERYKEQVKCIYIDPPYNTEDDREKGDFLYKDSFEKSTWIAMFENRLMLGKPLLSQEGLLACHMDEHEHLSLEYLIQQEFSDGDMGKLVWDKRNPKGDAKGLSAQHEYIHFAVKNTNYLNEEEAFVRNKANAEAMLDKVEKLIKKHGITEKARKEYKEWLKENKDKLSGGEKAYNQIDENGDIFQSVSMAWPNKKKAPDEYFIPLIHPITQNPCPVPARGWRNPPETMKKLLEKDLILFGEDETTQPRRKYLLKENLTENVSSLYYMGSSDDELFKHMNFEFDNPKPIQASKYFLSITARPKSSLILDYFAGSGTTAHAVINLNREDGGNRKYILVEQGEYFDSVLKPRVQKVIFAKEWKDGKPQVENGAFGGVSQIVKVLKLESYEDTLNNLALRKPAQDLADMGLSETVQNDYLLNYMLDVESRGSLLNTQHFAKPFDYQLNIATTSAGAYEAKTIDLVETFNYLIGLRVDEIDDQREKRGWVTVKGQLANGDNALIIWRDCEKVGYEALNDFIRKNAYGLEDKAEYSSETFKVVYINGDHNVPTVFADSDESVKTLKVRSIEAEFLSRMFGE